MSGAARLRSFLRQRLVGLVEAITGRRLAFLPAARGGEDEILALAAPYRVEGVLDIEIREPGSGLLSMALLDRPPGPFKRVVRWEAKAVPYGGPSLLHYDTRGGAICLDGVELGSAIPLRRRFCWALVLSEPSGVTRSRTTGHYIAGESGRITQDYFYGSTYVDHESQSQGEHSQVAELIKTYRRSQRPVLEIGCATGGLLEVLGREQVRSFGLDVSEWAIDQASKRVGAGRAWLCDVERDPIPSHVVAEAPFGAIVMWAVLEHFREPFRVVEKLATLCEPGSILVINTTNAGSLSHKLFGSQWEGYFDATHAGVDAIDPASLRTALEGGGWRIELLKTRHVWDGNDDPTHATVRDWYSEDVRFRKLLVERDLGDLITCIAIRR